MSTKEQASLQPTLNKGKDGASPTNCLQNLKNIKKGFKVPENIFKEVTHH